MKNLHNILGLLYVTMTFAMYAQSKDESSDLLDSLQAQGHEYFMTYKDDSLKLIINQIKETTVDQNTSKYRAKSNEWLAELNVNEDTSVYYPIINQAIQEYSVLGDINAALMSKWKKGRKKQYLGDHEGAIFYYRNLLVEIENAKGELTSQQYCHLNTISLKRISTNYEQLGLLKNALDYAQLAEQEASNCDNVKARLHAFQIISVIIAKILEEQPNNILYQEKAIRYFNDMLSLSKSSEEPVFEAIALLNSAIFYKNRNNYSQAKDRCSQAFLIPHVKKENDPRLTSHIYLTTAEVFQKEGNKDSSSVYVEKMRIVATKAKSIEHDAWSNLNYGKWLLKEGRTKEAIFELKKIEFLTPNNKENIRLSHKSLSEAYKHNKNYEDAFYFITSFHQLTDSLQNYKNQRQIAMLINESDLANQEKKIAELKAVSARQNQIKYLMIAGLIILITSVIAIIFFFRQKVLKTEQIRNNIQQRLFRSQMNPHFIFNMLGSIQTFLLDKGSSEKAAQYLSKFAKLMRQILTQSQCDMITLEEEIETLENYLILQKMRYNGTFNYDIKVDIKDHPSDIEVPPMILQPILENAIEHGRIHAMEGGNVKLVIRESANNLLVSVIDNGVGRKATKIPVLHKESMALNIIKDRLEYLGKTLERNLSLTFSDAHHRGTQVEITLPLMN